MVEPDRISDTTLIDAKAGLRRDALARRDALPAEARQAAAETIARRDFPLDVRPGVLVSGFSSIGSEINPMEMTEAATTPVVAASSAPTKITA